MSAHTATDAGGLGPIDVSIDGEAEEPPANLNTLPVDVLLHLAAMLDGVDLAALEGTASNIRRLLRGQLAPLWVALHAQIDKVPDHRADDSDAKRKSDYVRVWAWTQQRCARPPTCISRPDPTPGAWTSRNPPANPQRAGVHAVGREAGVRTPRQTLTRRLSSMPRATCTCATGFSLHASGEAAAGMSISTHTVAAASC